MSSVVSDTREPDALRRLLERHVDAADALAAAGELPVRDRGHHAIVKLLRDVLRALAGEIERRDALLLAERERRVGGVRAVHDERVIVAERRRREVVRRSERERPPLRRETHARAMEIARTVRRLAGEEEHEASQHEIGEDAARRFPAHVLGAHHALRGGSQERRQLGGIRGHGLELRDRGRSGQRR